MYLGLRRHHHHLLPRRCRRRRILRTFRIRKRTSLDRTAMASRSPSHETSSSYDQSRRTLLRPNRVSYTWGENRMQTVFEIMPVLPHLLIKNNEWNVDTCMFKSFHVKMIVVLTWLLPSRWIRRRVRSSPQHPQILPRCRRCKCFVGPSWRSRIWSTASLRPKTDLHGM